MSKVIIVGSSRKDSDTSAVINALIQQSEFDVIYLNDFHINYYDYQNQNSNDDFLPLMREVIPKYNLIVYATPVYWYSMSGIMKVFFDRLTDLLTIEKDLGRKLRGMGMAVISCSKGEHLGENFWHPFAETANYLGMEYLGNIHTISGKENKVEIEEFLKMIEQ